MNLVQEQLNRANQGLTGSFHVSPASCNNPDYYGDYIRLNAVADYQIGMGVTHLLIDKDAGKLAGYVTLRSTSLVSVQEDKMRVQPAVEIAELAVHKDYERQGVGTALLNIAVAKVDRIRETELGIKSVVVCPDPCAIGFYKRFGFTELSSLYEVLHDGWNDNCDPLILTLPEQQFK